MPLDSSGILAMIDDVLAGAESHTDPVSVLRRRFLTDLGHWGGVKVDLLRKRLRLGKAAVSGAGTQSGDACEGGP